jgi:hypothetical protein
MIWVGIVAALGFAVSAVFSSMLEFPRAPFVLVHALGACARGAVRPPPQATAPSIGPMAAARCETGRGLQEPSAGAWAGLERHSRPA